MINNIRRFPGEKDNDPDFAQMLALLGDVYVNDAFSASHRSHASIVGVPQYLPAYAGLLLNDEIENLSRALSPDDPFYLILGGAKFDTKLPLVEKFFDVAERIFVLGALAHDFFVAQGVEVGKSLVDKDVDVSGLINNSKIGLPIDVVVSRNNKKVTLGYDEVAAGDVIFDAGPNTIEEIKSAVSDAKTILWNGPLGNFEKGFESGTKQLAHVIAQTNAYSVVGGGDTIAAIQDLGLESSFGFVSTGGGAMLDFLAKGTLPGIDALTQHHA